MSADRNTTGIDGTDEFTREAAKPRSSLVAEFWSFLKHNKKWWLLPILLAVVAIGVLIAVSSIGAAPFIYPLF
jgi:hypothetical protein